MYSAYISDVINITDNLIATVSFRADAFDSKGTRNHYADTIQKDTKYNQTTLSHKYGIVYQVVKNKVSLFANYMNGFIYLQPIAQPAVPNGHIGCL